MAGLNRDILLRNLALTSAFSLFTVFSARLGDVTLAANAVLMNFHTLAGYVLDGFADAAEALVGQAVGRRARDQFHAAVRAAALWVGGFAVVLVVLLLVLGGAFVDIMTVLPEVRAAARDFMPYVAIAPLIGAWAFLLDGVFMGATRGPEMRNAMMLALVAFIAAAYVLFMVARVALLGRYLPRLARGIG
jgi:MATE family multidrug resistance protein